MQLFEPNHNTEFRGGSRLNGALGKPLLLPSNKIKRDSEEGQYAQGSYKAFSHILYFSGTSGELPIYCRCIEAVKCFNGTIAAT